MADDKSILKHERVFAPDKTDAEGRVNLIGLSLEELKTLLQDYQIPNFRAKQIWHWMYHRGVHHFSDMQNLPQKLIDQLDQNFAIGRASVEREQRSIDGTIKWLLKMQDGQMVETVYIPEDNRGTLCVSSQVGCTLACKFCHTGTQALVRNLGAHEVLQQILHARDVVGEWPHKDKAENEKRSFTNIVMMGMGEPLYNYTNVAKALKICMDADGLSISKRRITLSTSGLVPMIEKCGLELNVNLAISLHATTDEVRSDIMAINKKYPLNELLDACRNYPLEASRKITFEYVMLADVNDTDGDAHNLATLLDNIPAKVNIIPFNPWPGSEYKCSSRNRIMAFARILEKRGVDAPIRKTRGEDILAACGQLKSDSKKSSVNQN
jgi:23S rRNA (adenine2503-C2)-methyltransferase